MLLCAKALGYLVTPAQNSLMVETGTEHTIAYPNFKTKIRLTELLVNCW